MGFSVDKNIYPVICFVSLFQYNKHEASGSQPAVLSRSLQILTDLAVSVGQFVGEN